MLRPSIFGEDLFDDWFAFPDFRDLDRTERKLYGRHSLYSYEFCLHILLHSFLSSALSRLTDVYQLAS